MKNEKPWSKYLVKNGLDLPFLLILLALLTIGLVMLLSASYFNAYYYNNDSLYYFKRQIFFAVSGIVLMLLISRLDYKLLRRFALLGMAVAVGFLILVLLLPSNGDGEIKRWINLGIFRFQPSEIAKFMLIIYCARGLDHDHKKLTSSDVSKLSVAQNLYKTSDKKVKITQGTTTLFYYLLVIVCIAGLVALESHLSGTILVLSIGVAMLWMGEGRARWFAIGLLAVTVLAVVLIKMSIAAIQANKDIPFLKDYMGERIIAWLNKSYEPRGARWQTNQSLYAIGSGGLLGSGLGNSKEKYLYVAEPQNDFIFAIVCEELGFVGATLILVLYAALILRGVYIGMRSKDRFGALIAFGMVVQLGLQVMLNVAVVTDTVPNTGIGLPFFSYGGSSMWMCLIEMGVVLGVSRQANLRRLYTVSDKHKKRASVRPRASAGE